MKYFIQNLVCSPDIFRSLVYSQLCFILKSKHIQNPAKYLRWSILLKTLCNYSTFRRPIYSKLSLIQNPIVLASPSCISYSFERLTVFMILYQKLTFSLAIDFFSQSLVYELQSSQTLHRRYLTAFWILFTS